MAQIAAEVLRLPTESVTVVHSDTGRHAFDMATLGSRSHVSYRQRGEARRRRCSRRSSTHCASSSVWRLRRPIADVFKKKYGMRAGSVTGVGNFIPPYTPPDRNGQSDNATPFWMVGGTGRRGRGGYRNWTREGDSLGQTLRTLHADQPAHRRDAALGGAIMQLWLHAVREDAVRTARGSCANASLAEYKIPGLLDLPAEIVNEAVVAEQRTGPYGAKASADGTFGVSPAVVSGARRDRRAHYRAAAQIRRPCTRRCSANEARDPVHAQLASASRRQVRAPCETLVE